MSDPRQGEGDRADVRERASQLVEDGDPAEAVRHLRVNVDAFGTVDLARVLARLAERSGFTDLADAGRRVVEDPVNGQARYDFGYACVERGVAFLAVPVLRELLRDLPGTPEVFRELVSALEDEGRHTEAVGVLRDNLRHLNDWPDRYLLAYNALLSGDVDLAATTAGALGAPGDGDWAPAWDRLTAMLDRAALLRETGDLGPRDLRGWHFVLTGGLLLELSPYGYDDGMNGRYALLHDDNAACAQMLGRLMRVLDAAKRRPTSVGLLSDRSSRVLGLAAAEIIGVRATPFTGPVASQLIVAYDLNECVEDELRALRDRSSGQVLFEHATCWTDPPAVSADASGRLAQTALTPWSATRRVLPDAGVQSVPADDRPEEELAHDLVSAEVAPSTRAGGTLDVLNPAATDDPPVDSEEDVLAFTARVSRQWLSRRRDRVPSAGPVPSSRFL